MKRISREYKIIRKKTTTLIILSVVCIVMNFLMVFLAGLSREMTEKIYTQGIYRFLADILNTISNPFPFSLSELIIGLQILCVVVWLARTLYELGFRRWRLAGYYIAAVVFVLSLNLFIYQFSWGLNNYRLSAEELFELEETRVSEDQLVEVYTYLVEDGNRLRAQLNMNEWTVDRVKKEAWVGYQRLGEKYPFISTKTVRVKTLIISPFFSRSGYTGMYLPHFSEANLNGDPPVSGLAFTASHEIAHQKGFAGEDEANLIGFMASMENDEYFQYSAILAMQTYIGNALYKTNEEVYFELAGLRSEEVLNDRRERRDFWEENIVERTAEVHDQINDTFLKANNQPDGILNYSKVTELIIYAYEKGIILD